MAWYENSYFCGDCNKSWFDEWSCGCDDQCPNCGIDYEPENMKDLSAFFEKTTDGTYKIFYSPADAAHHPDYTFFAEVIHLKVARALEQVASDLAKPL